MSYHRSSEKVVDNPDRLSIISMFAGMIAMGASFVKSIFSVKEK